MSRTPVSVTFVIPVKNDAARLRSCLASIAANTHPQEHVACIVADNGSTDDSQGTARSAGATVLEVPGERVSAVRNRAAAAAHGDLLAFVDADHEIAPGWIAAAVDTMSDPAVAGAGALCLPPANGTNVQKMYGVLRGRTIGRSETTWLGSGNLVVRRTVFQSLGGFDESLETCEDVDLCGRLRATGQRLISDERLVNIHLGDPAFLASVFTSERWRGRDNLRVSFRHSLTLRDLPSILIPILGAAALVVAVAGLVLLPFAAQAAATIVLGAGTTLAALSGLRAARMIARGRLPFPQWPLAFAVALAYDLGRACSLVFPAGHRQRQRSEHRAAGAGR